MKDQPLPHELIISQLYQQQKTEQPSLALDAKILEQAKAQLNKQSGLVNNSPVSDIRSDAARKTKSSPWRSKLSWAASVGLLCVLFYTQQPEVMLSDEFASPLPEMNSPSALEQQSDDLKTIEVNEPIALGTAELKQSDEFISSKTTEYMTDKAQVSRLKSTASRQVVLLKKEKMFDRTMLADNSAQVAPMSLPEMSKLVEVITLEMAISQKDELRENAKLIELQNTLIEHLTQYQKAHPEFAVPAKFLAVLNDQQKQQLLSAKH